MDAEQIHPPSGSGARILSIGDDRSLLSSRQMVLESAGYQVHSEAGGAAIDGELILHCDLAILCHSLDPQKIETIARTLREWNPGLPVLLLTKFEICPGESLDGLMNSATTPGVLLGKIDEMMTAAKKAPGSVGIGDRTAARCNARCAASRS